MDIKEWINERVASIVNKLPTLSHTDTSIFSYGYRIGYKQALLDLDRLMAVESMESIE